MENNSALLSGMAGKRVTMQVDVAEDVQELLRAYAKEVDRNQKAVVARLIKWFVSQSAPVKRVAQQDVDEEMRIAYADILEEMAEKLRGGIVTGQPGQAADGKPTESPPPKHQAVPKREPKR